ncbi:MAG TPA: GspH/FimT family pseudopilin [Vicinamibacterales bacterium]|nr:GspH/FimT family pseudopilin [Vicinamibacterales bacterium]
MGNDRKTGEAGFTLIEILITTVVTIAIGAMLVPKISNLMQSQRARTAARAVERELQSARLKAVTNSKRMRVKLNCPVAGQLRMVEVTGVAATDNASNRCDETAFPFPGPRDALRSTPSLDAPLVRLPLGTTITSVVTTFEFGPRGDAGQVGATGIAATLANETTITVTRAGYSSAIRINPIGKIKID